MEIRRKDVRPRPGRSCRHGISGNPLHLSDVHFPMKKPRDPDGSFAFFILPEGDYRVAIDQQSLPFADRAAHSYADSL